MKEDRWSKTDAGEERKGRKERRGPALGGPARSASPDSPTPPEPKRWWRALSSAGGMAARSSSMPCAYGQCGPARAGASSGKRQGARQAGAPETHHLSRRVGASAQAATAHTSALQHHNSTDSIMTAQCSIMTAPRSITTAQCSALQHHNSAV